ncbi:MAG: DNA translocase FtsK 4TM domain-containing protein, partial [Actinomycetota bacterium]|nr:DNA translocase FtsK 4TM domain-containing protein [Actinomycetota bacterium]
MATSRSSRSTRSTSRSTSRAGTTRRAPAKKRPPAKKRLASKAPPSTVRRLAEAGLEDRGLDLLGLILIVVALLSGLALVGDRAGLVGQLLEDGFGAMVGVFRFLVPFALLWSAVSMFRDRDSDRSWRIGFGVLVLSLSFMGVAHLLSDADGIRSSTTELRDGGGLLGAVIAEPLRRLVAEAGAWVVLLVAALFGALVAADLRIRQVIEGAGALSRWLRDVLASSGGALSRLRSDPQPQAHVAVDGVPGLSEVEAIDLDEASVEMAEPIEPP